MKIEVNICMTWEQTAIIVLAFAGAFFIVCGGLALMSAWGVF